MFSIDALDISFAEKFMNVRVECMKQSIITQPVLGFINVFLHAEIWKQSKQDQAVDEAIAKLQNEGCNFLSSILMCASSVHSKHKTNRLPGMSWHNWGRAVDVKLMHKDSLNEIDKNDQKVQIFEDIVSENELYLDQDACGFGCSDGYHLQDSNIFSPEDVYEPHKIDKEIYRSYRDDNIKL